MSAEIPQIQEQYVPQPSLPIAESSQAAQESSSIDVNPFVQDTEPSPSCVPISEVPQYKMSSEEEEDVINYINELSEISLYDYFNDTFYGIKPSDSDEREYFTEQESDELSFDLSDFDFYTQLNNAYNLGIDFLTPKR